MDGTLYPTARACLDELSRLLNLTRAGHPDFAVVHPGLIVPMYGCSLAAVRVAAIAPTPTGPRASQCGTTLHTVTLELVVDRCYTTPDDNSMPPIAVLDSHTRDLTDDAAAMRTAAQCFRTDHPSTVLGAWTPRGPAGGIYGGALTATITLDLGCGCTTPDDAWPNVDDIVPPLAGDPRVP